MSLISRCSCARAVLYDLDLSPIADRREYEMSWAWLTMDQGDLPSAPQPLWTTNVHEMAAADATLPFKAAVSFTTLRDSRINAFTTWFVAEFDGKVTLTNAPTAPMTHWGRYLFPLRGPLQLRSGTPIEVQFACIPTGPGYSTYEWSARIGDSEWEHHDS